jgi:hypothetical protein
MDVLAQQLVDLLPARRQYATDKICRLLVHRS